MDVLSLYFLGLAGVIGACVGSFLNVVAYRLPLGLSLISPGSRCPHCLTPLGITENLPVLGWAVLGGRCKHCREPISWRYPLVELSTALLFLVLYARFGMSLTTLAYAVLVSLLTALALIDLDTLELPHELTLPGIYLGLGWQVVQLAGQVPVVGLLEGLLGYGVAVFFLDAIAWLGRAYLWFKTPVGRFWNWEPFAVVGLLGLGWLVGGRVGVPLAGSLTCYGGAVLLWDSFFILRSFSAKEPALAQADEQLVALGGGDVLLGGLMGAWLGWEGLVVAVAIGFGVGAFWGILARVTGRLEAMERFALGPFLAVGGVISALGGGNVWFDNYLRLLGIT
ncbi:prepilin peptidase [Anthocerotibacter panamensis]|uniref:prepilin peptidase n=1 Tax=Anthocerotibacter panamensis TaxID=2857077 RepID=UPI001C4027EF|nr:prepilin peptidase [Anthocerotibacter panamensis]